MRILGISCFYHDAAASIVEDGRIVAAAQEERFTRKKHDDAFPENAVRYCLAEAGVSSGEIDAVAFYDKPILKFHRILETYFAVAPRGLRPFMKAVPLWLREKLWIDPEIRECLSRCGVTCPEQIYFPEHHESHAASAFYPSPFDEAAVLTVDGVGEWATASIAVGEGSDLRLIQQLSFPHSLGLLYSAFTYFTGFKVNSAEYKLMGLAPYGEGIYTDRIMDELLDLKEDGSFRLNMDYFGYLDDLVMTNEKFSALFGGPAAKPEAPVTRREMDIARSIQEVTEEIVLRMARHARDLTGKDYLCAAGGVALNCVANGRILREGIFKDVWFQPAAGDAGGSLGAALAVWHKVLRNPRTADGRHDSMQGSYLGPEFSREQIQEYLDARGYAYTELADDAWAGEIATLVANQMVVGLFHGRMEFGPRALGNRSIIGDARSPKMQSILNLKIKYRESFRPFAPSCLEERLSDYFEIDRPSPYMMVVAPVREDLCTQPSGDEHELEIHEWVNRRRSELPAITHVDYSARIQSVNRESNPRYHRLIEAFEALTGCGVIINTSFNVRGEPIVCTPADAYRCFMRTEMDHLVLGPFLLSKGEQPEWQESGAWRKTFQPD
ncbi:MAG: carbamoyltransferase [Deltaproteobacteria bacterium]|nr:MAG: carbamoyltransferase [Deltaproteobacteria bacterium]